MDHNKNEALRAKSIAEAKFEQSDYISAKKFASIAQNLYPELDGISQMLSTLDVFLYAENKINGEPDWYGVLGVDSSADDTTMRKQYKKMALMVHPDKNKFIGADGAFKLVSEAWSLLSDQEKRLAYDRRREFKLFGQKILAHGGGPSVQSTENYFWTTCRPCNCYYEYRRTFINQTLYCRTCHRPFIALEVAPPPF